MSGLFLRRLILVAGSLPLVILPALAQKSQSSGAVLPGGNGKEPVNIEATRLEYFDKEQKLLYSGHVVATQGESTLHASTLTIYLTPKEAGSPAGAPSSSSEVRHMDATGPVTLMSKDQVGTGDSGVYERSENKVYLIGNVTLTQGQNITKGDKVVYDLTTNQAVVTGRVRSMFISNGNDSKETKPAKPEAGQKSGATAKTPSG
ncbi:MAG: lipopolysaccharide transport periplasmic protein LptA [Alphaproteobacteria bacterium]|nr:lipopolysaccharide transport periplasmic protein LptA [Alphaproteobacteria bacterium]